MQSGNINHEISKNHIKHLIRRLESGDSKRNKLVKQQIEQEQKNSIISCIMILLQHPKMLFITGII